MLPGQPPTFRQPSAADRPWWWRLEDASGAVLEVAGHSDQRFATQGEAPVRDSTVVLLCCGSMSTSSTRYPAAARQTDRFSETVVLPTPPVGL